MFKVTSRRSVRPATRWGWSCHRRGFTLLEIMMVVLILAIAAAMAVPLMSSGAATKASAAAQMVAADLEYARSMAFTRGHVYRVTFDAGAESYQVQDQDGAVIAHPVNQGSTYHVQFGTGQLTGVQIVSANFDGTHQVRFDALGSPYNGNGTPLNSGVIILQGGSTTQTIRVEPVTGVIRIDD
jgi:prepilin-type N-terminal cleavage/methylation domain-containing protein